MRRMNEAGMALLRKWEAGPGGGPALTAYRCPAGKWTLGFGITGGVSEGDTCTADEAEAALRRVADHAAEHVAECVVVPLTDNQLSALACMAFNIGDSAFAESTLATRLNLGQYDEVPEQMRRWNHAGGKVLAGLTNRREAEVKLWLTP